MEQNENMEDQKVQNIVSLLASTALFCRVPNPLLAELAKTMSERSYDHNELMLKQGDSSDRTLFLAEGVIKRTRVKEDGVEHVVSDDSIVSNSMHVVPGDPVYASVKCISDNCKTYELGRDALLEHMRKSPTLSSSMVSGLSYHLRHSSRKMATPLLEQHSKETNVPAVSIAAGIESYYRSALNAMLNQRLTGIRADLFPNMHVQVPIRVMYINGFKGLRSIIERNVQPDNYTYPSAVRLVAAVAPGILMTPLSSVLEASNAGHKNPEPLSRRWIRGILPRGAREIIFGIGLNQLSDFFEERMSPMLSNNQVLSNAAGSLAAGVVSGYLSHVPHNLSTFKLMEPHRNYIDLFKMFVDKSVPASVDSAVSSWSPLARNVTRAVFATFFPRGVVIRTVQIVGSFIILNGTINVLVRQERLKLEKVLNSV
eukprot:CAMPEP_0182447312 /NCGR_PEP_ID=MMETSP1172-20130603/14471_1 /TAXON_ID=708627 /ORGANISM="Timspurckia oligopyrenoides, Strain CCMP3278" /LENGTH=426 /DNA_ID=CAMNT_0024643703 /DNA_START=56 /DNA_END=1336 /DNA_ORIENTATION=-